MTTIKLNSPVHAPIGQIVIVIAEYGEYPEIIRYAAMTHMTTARLWQGIPYTHRILGWLPTDTFNNSKTEIQCLD